VQGVGNLRQDFGAPMLFARSLAEPRRFQQAAQLSGEDGGFGGEVFIKKSFIGIMQKRRGADDFIEDHERSGHHGTGLELARRREGGTGLHLIYEDRAAIPHGLGGDGALLWKQSKADETVGQFAIGLFSDEFFAGMTAPKVNAADLKKFTGSGAEELNQ